MFELIKSVRDFHNRKKRLQSDVEFENSDETRQLQESFVVEENQVWRRKAALDDYYCDPVFLNIQSIKDGIVSYSSNMFKEDLHMTIKNLKDKYIFVS